MTIAVRRPALPLALLLSLISISTVRAADVDGVWASHADICNKIFVKKGDAVAFASDADMHGSGFIIEGNRLRGKFATCSIKNRKDEGNTVNFVAACSTDVAVEMAHFVLKIISDKRVSRTFPGLPELDTPYDRCSM